jgi:ribonucleoside-diphosphate reductase alpha chain
LGREDFIQVPATDEQRAHLAVNQKHNLPTATIQNVVINPVSAPVATPAPIGFMKPTPVAEPTSSAPEASATSVDQTQAYLKSFGDSPACPSCGSLTIRSGACYKCMNCGTQTGCS